MKISSEEIYRCTSAEWLQKYFDEEGRRKRHVEGCNGVSFEILRDEQGDGQRVLVAEFVERINANKAVTKIFGETTRFEETSTWREGSNEVGLVIKPEKMRDRLDISGRYVLTDLDDGTCKVVLEMEVKAKIFGIGGLIEKMAIKEAPGSFAKDAAYFNAHLVG